MAKDTSSADETAAVPLDPRIVQLEAKLKEMTESHRVQQERADKLAKAVGDRDRRLTDLQEALEAQKAASTLVDSVVVLNGVVYDITGTFRADNTFSEVKRGHCDEGVTLVAIGKPH